MNPSVLIEVLSPPTEAYDRGAKFVHYHTIATLREYVLVAQGTPRIEIYERQPDDRWLLTDVQSLEASVHLPSIDVILPLAEIYEKVVSTDLHGR